ncbi:MAG: BMP family ABC transporter substrate-binding protein [Oscillospiraceae bacterium]
MKKILVLLLSAAMMTAALAGCGTTTPASSTPVPDATEQTEQSTTTGSDSYELALITDVGTIDDKSFNQGSWEGLKKYADEFGITHKYYKPAEKTDAAYLESIDLAVKGGAKIIVTPGYLFEPSIYQAQDLYPDVKFILVDGVPNADGEQKINENVVPILYAEEQSGFLAGYAAVKDGYKKLGYMGGIAVPAVIKFGYGFVQGAEYAATELGLKAGELEIKYTYVGNFEATPENQTLASSWFQGGTELIFACGGGVGNSVMSAAEQAGKKVIGVDVDQSGESETVITSAMKMLGNSVYQTIEQSYANAFPGGKLAMLDASTDAVGLPMESSKFNTFTQADYDAIFAKVAANEIKILDHEGIADASKLPVKIAKVSVIA